MSGAPNTYGRIWRTASGGYVGDGHLDAEVLVAGPADPLPADFDPDLFGAGIVPAVEAVEVEPEGDTPGITDEPTEPTEPAIEAPAEPAKGKAKK
jgi:hypothetical protein